MKPLSLFVMAAVWAASLFAAWHFGRETEAKKSEERVRLAALEAAPGKPASLSQPKAGGADENATAANAAGAQSLEQILAQIKTVMSAGGMNNPLSAIKALTLLGQIRDEDISAALASAEEMKEPQFKMMLYMVLLSRWAEKDAPAALAYADDKLAGQGPLMNMARMGIISSWAQSDPDAAWKHIQEQEGEGGPLGSRTMALAGIFGSLAAKDPDKAFARLAELEEEDERAMALTGMAQATAFDDASRQKLMDKIAQLPDVDERKKAHAAILGQLTMLDPAKAMELAATLPEGERRESIDQVGTMLMMSDPPKAASYILENAEPDKKDRAYEKVINQWANSDTNAAGAWLGSQPQGPELDSARASFSRIASSKDPESAMEWAKTVTDEQKRGSAVEQVYKTWQKKDATAANAALDASGLSAEKITTIRAGKK